MDTTEKTSNQDPTFRSSFANNTDKKMLSTKTIRNYQEKSRKIAYEVIEDPAKRKKFKRLMLEGDLWINELAKLYGPLTGYELNEFIHWFKTAEKSKPKKKNLPVSKEPKLPVLEQKIVVNEGGISPEGTVVINKPAFSFDPQGIIEASTNSFCGKTEECFKVTFKAKQRFVDINEMIKKHNGNLTSEMIEYMPEKDCEEIAKEPPISVPEKYEAFLIEEVLLPPPPQVVEPVAKPQFVTNFRPLDNLKIKTETAKAMLTKDVYLYEEPYRHAFRDECDPKSIGKPEFVLRLPKVEQPKVANVAEPLEKIKKQIKEEKIRKENEEKKKRMELHGKDGGEWVSTFKPISSFYEMGSGLPHKLLPKDGYTDYYKTSSRIS